MTARGRCPRGSGAPGRHDRNKLNLAKHFILGQILSGIQYNNDGMVWKNFNINQNLFIIIEEKYFGNLVQNTKYSLKSILSISKNTQMTKYFKYKYKIL